LIQLKMTAEGLLNQALPVLERSLDALNCLTKADMAEIKCLAKPPRSVMEVSKAVCILFQLRPKGKGSLEDYWQTARTNLLDDWGFLDRLIRYDKDNIPESIILRLDDFVSNDELRPENIRRVSVAAEGLCMWVRAMHTYHNIAKQVLPQRFLLMNGQERLSLANQNLQLRRNMLRVFKDLKKSQPTTPVPPTEQKLQAVEGGGAEALAVEAERAEAGLELRVHSLNGLLCTVMAQRSWSLEDAMRAVEDASGVPMNQQMLLHENDSLHDATPFAAVSTKCLAIDLTLVRRKMQERAPSPARSNVSSCLEDDSYSCFS